MIFHIKTAMGGSKKDNPNLSMAEKLFLEEKKIIEEIVKKQDCVIVGRCGSFILKDRADCLKVFVRADDIVDHPAFLPIEQQHFITF